MTPTTGYLAGWSKRLTPSSMQRADACIRSEAMPHSHSSGDAATKGTLIHKFLADVLELGLDEALNRTENPDDIEWLSCIQVEKLPAFDPQGYVAEVALGGGAAPTLGTIGGSGPTGAAQTGWLKVTNSAGSVRFAPLFG